MCRWCSSHRRQGSPSHTSAPGCSDLARGLAEPVRRRSPRRREVRSARVRGLYARPSGRDGRAPALRACGDDGRRGAGVPGQRDWPHLCRDAAGRGNRRRPRSDTSDRPGRQCVAAVPNLRECDEPVAGAQRFSHARDRHPLGPRRRSCAPHRATAHRSPGRGCGWRARGARARLCRRALAAVSRRIGAAAAARVLFDFCVVLFASAALVATTFLIGLAPALRLARWRSSVPPLVWSPRTRRGGSLPAVATKYEPRIRRFSSQQSIDLARTLRLG